MKYIILGSMGPCSLGHSSFRTVQCWEEKSFTFRTSYNSSKPSVPCRQYYYSSHCASIPNVLSKKLQQLKLKILQKNQPNRCYIGTCGCLHIRLGDIYFLIFYPNSQYCGRGRAMMCIHIRRGCHFLILD